jgi:hypothetical protein
MEVDDEVVAVVPRADQMRGHGRRNRFGPTWNRGRGPTAEFAGRANGALFRAQVNLLLASRHRANRVSGARIHGCHSARPLAWLNGGTRPRACLLLTGWPCATAQTSRVLRSRSARTEGTYRRPPCQVSSHRSRRVSARNTWLRRHTSRTAAVWVAEPGAPLQEWRSLRGSYPAITRPVLGSERWCPVGAGRGRNSLWEEGAGCAPAPTGIRGGRRSALVSAVR